MVSREGFCNDQKINIKELADLSGFPESLIKKELVLEGDNLTLDKLRLNMLKFLDKTFEEFN